MNTESAIDLSTFSVNDTLSVNANIVWGGQSFSLKTTVRAAAYAETEGSDGSNHLVVSLDGYHTIVFASLTDFKLIDVEAIEEIASIGTTRV